MPHRATTAFRARQIVFRTALFLPLPPLFAPPPSHAAAAKSFFRHAARAGCRTLADQLSFCQRHCRTAEVRVASCPRIGRMLNAPEERRLFPSSILSLHTSAATNDSTGAATQAERKLRRFWKTTTVGEFADGFQILLDGRPLKTPEGQLLVVPSQKRTLAMLLADEWDRQEKVLQTHSLPLTSIVARSIDGLRTEDGRNSSVERLMKFLETDSVCYHQTYPDTLVQFQQEYFEPILEWVQSTYGVSLSVTKELLGAPHPEETTARLRKEVEEMEPLTLAAFEKAAIHTKSFLIALALVKRAITAKTAAKASRVEVMTQTKFWGEVEDAHDVEDALTEQQLGAVVCTLLVPWGLELAAGSSPPLAVA